MNRRLLRTQKATLLVAGGVLVAVGALILVSPQAFFAANNIDTGASTSLLNELKAPAAMLMAAGVFGIIGVFIPRLADTATWLAALIYLSYAASRLLSMTTDGLPAAGLIQAAILEGVLGLLCLAITVLRREPKANIA